MKIPLADFVNETFMLYTMLRFHSIVLIVCSSIGFIGHFIQFGIARLTPWIPAVVGLLIMFLVSRAKRRKKFLNYMPVIPALIFGVVTTIMSIRFAQQDFQPLRKKIIFSVMSASAWITVGYAIRLPLTKIK